MKNVRISQQDELFEAMMDHDNLELATEFLLVQGRMSDSGGDGKDLYGDDPYIAAISIMALLLQRSK